MMVSVIIPTYNRSPFLAAAVHSLLSQTRPPAEIIIVDDGSAEEHQTELTRIAAQSPSITLHRLPSNQGVAHARNQGTAAARGDYLLFLDDDDVIHPKMLATAMATFAGDQTLDVLTFFCQVKRDPADRSRDHFMNVLFIDKGFPPRSWQGWLTRRHQARQAEELQRDPLSALVKSCPAINACVIAKRALAGCAFPTELTIGEDWYFWLSLAARGARFRACARSYAFVHRHRSNTTRAAGDFFRKVTACLHRIEASGMLTRRPDRFNIRARLCWAYFHQRDYRCLKYLFELLGAPDLLLETLAFYAVEKL